MAEIDDVTLARYRELERLIGETQSNPDARKHLDRAIKAVRPNVETEEEVAERYAQPVKAELEATRKELRDYIEANNKREQEWRENEEKRAMHSAFARLRQAKGYTDDGINDIAKLMMERGIADPEAASLLYDNLHPPAPEIQTSSYEPQRWSIAPEDDLKRLFTDEHGWEANAIDSALRDVRGQNMH